MTSFSYLFSLLPFFNFSPSHTINEQNRLKACFSDIIREGKKSLRRLTCWYTIPEATMKESFRGEGYFDTILNTTRISQPHTHREPCYASIRPHISSQTKHSRTHSRHTPNTHHTPRIQKPHTAIKATSPRPGGDSANTGGLYRLGTTTFVPRFRMDHSIPEPALGEFAAVSHASTFEHDHQELLEKFATGTERLNCRLAEVRTKKK